MRVTRETRRKTRQAILEGARRRFAEVGYAAATTRDLASAAGIAAGTLYNYFPTKEALGLALVAEALEAAEVELEAARREGESLEERLFAQVAVQLRQLEPMRPWLLEVLEAAFSPLRDPGGEDLGAGLRQRHLERVSAALREDGALRPEVSESAVDLHLYWSLYLGVLGFWARDESRRQEATLALLDRAIELFCRALREP